MSTISLYPKTWAMYQQAILNIANPHGAVLLNDTYVFDENHRDYGDIPVDAIIAEATLSTIQYEGANNRYTVADATFLQVIADETVSSIILFRSDEWEGDSKLVYHSSDLTGIPLVTTGADITLSFPGGVLVLAPSGYTTPTISIMEEVGISSFDEQINDDINDVIMNPEEFGTTIQYTHSNGKVKTYVVLKTATPGQTQLSDVDMTSIAQTIKIQNSSYFYPPQRGDKVIMEGISYNVAGAEAENYTTDMYLQTTVSE